MQNNKKHISYAKWGYIFILPFFLSYAIFSLIPLADTIRNSFYEYYAFDLKTVGPNWVGRLLFKRTHWETVESQPFKREEQGATPRPPAFSRSKSSPPCGPVLRFALQGLQCGA